MNLKLSKTAIRELTKRYRAVLMAALVASAFVAGGANAAVEINTSGLSVTVSALDTPTSVSGTATITGLGTMAEENTTSYYTKTAADERFATKTALGILDDKVVLKANASDVYTKTDADAKFVEQVSGKGLSSNDYTDADAAKVAALGTASTKDISFFQAAETGKGLSSNDYTDADAAKVAALGTASTKDVSFFQAAETGKGLSTNDFTDTYKDAIDNLGTMASQAKSASYTSGDPSALPTWLTANSDKFADVDTTLNVLTDRLTVVQSDLMDKATNTGSIAYALNGNTTADKTLIQMVQEVALDGLQEGNGIDIATDGTISLTTAVTNNLLDAATTSKGLTITDGDGSNAANIALNLATDGGLEEDATNGLQIATKGVKTAMIDDGAVTATQIADHTITGTQIATDAALEVASVTATGALTGNSVKVGGTSGIELTKSGDYLNVAAGSGLKVGDGKFTVDSDGKIQDVRAIYLNDATGTPANKVGFTATDDGLVIDKAVNATNGFIVDTDNSLTSGSLKLAGTEVNSIGTDASAVAAANTKVLATGASVYLGAQDAQYTATGPNITAATTLKTAIDTLDENMGALSAMNHAAFSSTPTTVTAGVNNLATNMATALGGGFTAGTWSGSVTPASSVDYAYGTPASNVMAAVGQVAGNIGGAASGTYGNVTGTNSVNANLDQLDGAIGKRSTLSTTNGNLTSGATVVASLNALDTTLGNVHALTNTSGNLAAANKSVAEHLTAIDARLGGVKALDGSTVGNLAAADKTVAEHLTALSDRLGGVKALDGTAGVGEGYTDNLAGADKTVAEHLVAISDRLGQIHGLNAKRGADAKGNLATGTTVEDHLVALDDAIGDRSQFAQSNYVQDNAPVANAVMSLDHNLHRVEKEMKGGFASVAAMSALQPNARAAGDTQIAVGAGAYRDHQGLALGAFHYFNDNIMANIGASYAGDKSTMVRAGVTFGW